MPGVVGNQPIGSLAHLGPARAYTCCRFGSAFDSSATGQKMTHTNMFERTQFPAIHPFTLNGSHDSGQTLFSMVPEDG